jgi:phytoene dehydrogenase-like protein
VHPRGARAARSRGHLRAAGGNLFHGRCRPIGSHCCARCPSWRVMRRRFAACGLCGAGTHPGGGVMGACGRNAALEILRAARATRTTWSACAAPSTATSSYST